MYGGSFNVDSGRVGGVKHKITLKMKQDVVSHQSLKGYLC